MVQFSTSELKALYRPDKDSSGEQNGQVTIIGGSALFHGAPILALKAASKIVDMVFFASPEKPMHDVAAHIKSELSSFIWVPFEEVEDYIKKSDAALIGPGLMRSHTEAANQSNSKDSAFEMTRDITEKLLRKFPDKKWVIDAGSLQVMEADWVPVRAILTPNKKEYESLFGEENPIESAKKHECFIVLKGPVTHVYTPDGQDIEVRGGNAGMTKGGTGDTMAGLTVALLAKNDPKLAASSAAFLVKKAGEELAKKSDIYFNADDLADMVPEVYASYIK